MTQFFKKLMPLISFLLIAAAASFVFSFFVVKSSTLHQHYLRHAVAPSVVSIVNPQNPGSGGTGFHVKAKSGKTYIMTNHHVCRVAGPAVKPGDEVLVISNQNGAFLKKVVAIYENSDLCLVEPLAGAKGLTVSTQPEKSDIITVVGHPMLQPTTVTSGEYVDTKVVQLLWGMDLPNSQCKGLNFKNERAPREIQWIVGATKVCIRSVNTMFTTAPSLPGNSGSPVVDAWGGVVGVLFSGMYPTNWAGVIPTQDIIEFLSKY